MLYTDFGVLSWPWNEERVFFAANNNSRRTLGPDGPAPVPYSEAAAELPKILRSR